MTTIVWITAAGILIFYFVIASKTNKCFIGGISSEYKELVCDEDELRNALAQKPRKYGMGLIPSQWPSGSQLLLSTASASDNMPATFDWMDQPYILGGVNSDPLDQGQCNSCYIMAPTSCLGDRLAIKLTQKGYDVTKPIVAAPIAPLSCACNVSSSAVQVCGGTEGGDVYSVGNWILDHPLPTNKCYPLPPQDDSNPPPISCITKFSKCACPNVDEENIKLKTLSVDGNTVMGIFSQDEITSLKQEIYNDGPLTVGIWAENLQYYTGTASVFNGGTEGIDGHAVVITGWDDNKNAWRVRNSWGKGQNFWLSYGAKIIEIATVTPDTSDENNLVEALAKAGYISDGKVRLAVRDKTISYRILPLLGAILVLVVLCYCLHRLANT